MSFHGKGVLQSRSVVISRGTVPSDFDIPGRRQLNEAFYKLEKSVFEVIISVGDEREDDIGSNCGQAVRRLRLG